MRRILPSAATALSLVLVAATAICWVIGIAGEKHAAVCRVRARPDRTIFARIGRQHLIVSEQRMLPAGMSPGYVMDSTRFREFRVTGPAFPDGVGTELSPDYFALNPPGAWFRTTRLSPGGIRVRDESGAVAWQVACSYGSVEVPWWSLILLFSAWPASRWAARARARARSRHGLCPACGYDVRATPGRCPECGAAATSLTTPSD